MWVLFLLVSVSQTKAIVKLLQDGDPITTRLLSEQLFEGGEDWVEDLHALAKMDDHRVSRVARQILQQIERSSAESDFDLFCRFFPEHGSLEEACWNLAEVLQPEADSSKCRKQINAWGRTLLVRIAGAVSTRERVKLLTDFMSRELSFRGNSDDYYNVRNSILPLVIETRSGLPILLCCITIFLSHRAGMNVVGVNLPGHFIVRHGDVFFDPFHRGRILTKQDCEQIIRCQGLEPDAKYFQQATSRQIFLRILTNLHFAFLRNGDEIRAAKFHSWLCALRRTI